MKIIPRPYVRDGVECSAENMVDVDNTLEAVRNWAKGWFDTTPRITAYELQSIAVVDLGCPARPELGWDKVFVITCLYHNSHAAETIGFCDTLVTV